MRENYIAPALRTGLIEYTILDKPNSQLQKYRLTTAGKKAFKEHVGEEANGVTSSYVIIFLTRIHICV
jgi:hypothetical protein